MNVDGWLAAVAPNYLPCLTKVLLIVGKDNEIIKRCDGTTARGKGQVSGFPPRFWAVIRRRHVEANEKEKESECEPFPASEPVIFLTEQAVAALNYLNYFII